MVKRVVWVTVLIGMLIGLVWMAPAFAQEFGLPKLNIQVTQGKGPEDLSTSLQILILLTVLTLAPAIVIMTTAFTRIVIVLSLVRQALGTPQLPPNQVIVGLAMILTFFVMSPTIADIQKTALDPYFAKKISQQQALNQTMEPIRKFMFKHTQKKDLELFLGLARQPRPKNNQEVPTHVLLPAFIIGELKTAFQLGFMIFLPFLIIDVVVSSMLVSMGMLFLPPASISLPFKLILFVLVDGWHLITRSLVLGFQQ